MKYICPICHKQIKDGEELVRIKGNDTHYLCHLIKLNILNALIAVVIGVVIVYLIYVSNTHAQTVTTSLTVTASVPCNPVNCPDIPKWYNVSDWVL